MSNEKRNRARTSSLRRKNNKTFYDKVLSSWERPQIKKMRESLGLEFEEATDTETDEHMNNEDFLELLKSMKPNKKENNGNITKKIETKRTWRERFKRK